MAYKIIADSSADLLFLEDIAFTSVPLKIITSEREYVDTFGLSVDGMIEDLKRYRGESKSSCPNAEEWLESFGNYDNIFCVSITSGLSGSYNAACVAMQEYLEQHPDRNGYVIDTLSAGPEVTLIVEKLKELISEGLSFEEIKEKIIEYNKRTRLVFALESLRNLANNGRVNAAVAKLSGILGIRVIGEASEEGVLDIISKARGYKKELDEIVKAVVMRGYRGGKMRIHHCNNLPAAKELKEKILTLFADAKIKIAETRGLCSFYAEEKGLLVGFEG